MGRHRVIVGQFCERTHIFICEGCAAAPAASLVSPGSGFELSIRHAAAAASRVMAAMRPHKSLYKQRCASHMAEMPDGWR